MTYSGPVAEIIFKSGMPDFKVPVIYCISLQYNFRIFWAEKQIKHSLSNLEKLITMRHKSWSSKMHPNTLLRISQLMLSLQFCSFVKSSTWEILLLRGMWPLLQNAWSQIQTASLPTRCVPVHTKTREGDSNSRNWYAFQGLRVMGQQILHNLIWLDLA